MIETGAREAPVSFRWPTDLVAGCAAAPAAAREDDDQGDDACQDEQSADQPVAVERHTCTYGVPGSPVRAPTNGSMRTQDALYAEIDLDLSWSERELPERERTKHVHRLHPYLGKFIPQLVEALLSRYVRPGGRVLDPFAGSGTTLVQSLESGYE